ncbi:MAG: hypothetical protein ACRCZI_12220 [Cetobacterium sp.]
MSVSIGRVGLAVSLGGDGLTLDDPLDWSEGADGTITLTGLWSGAAQNHAHVLAVAQQILDLKRNRAEPVVPVISNNATAFDGWYRVVDSSVSHPQGGVSGNLFGNGSAWFDWSVTLRRPRDWRHARIESNFSASLISNTTGLTTGDAFQAVPGDATSRAFDWAPNLLGNRSHADGAGTLYTGTFDGISVPLDGGVRYSLGQLNGHYKGSCRVLHQPYTTFISALAPQSWLASSNGPEMNNGVVKVVWPQNGSMQISWWDGAAWDGPSTVILSGVTTAGQVGPFAAHLLHLSPVMSVMRYQCLTVAGATWGEVTVDLLLRRGSRAVSGRLYSTAQSDWRLDLEAGAVACTAISGGIRRTADDGNGNRQVLVSKDATVNDLVNGRITQSGATFNEFIFGITCEIGGSTATGQNTAANQAQEWAFTTAEHLTVVGA